MMDFYEQGMPLMIVVLIAVPVMFIVIGYLSLRYTERYVNCGAFLQDFYKVAFKVKGTEEKNDSEIDKVA